MAVRLYDKNADVGGILCRRLGDRGADLFFQVHLNLLVLGKE